MMWARKTFNYQHQLMVSWGKFPPHSTAGIMSIGPMQSMLSTCVLVFPQNDIGCILKYNSNNEGEIEYQINIYSLSFL